jgi:hypothetical protein
MRDEADLPRDHLTRTGRELRLGVRQLEHSDGITDRDERIAQLMGQQGQELIFRPVVALGAGALAVGLEELAEIRHD